MLGWTSNGWIVNCRTLEGDQTCSTNRAHGKLLPKKKHDIIQIAETTRSWKCMLAMTATVVCHIFHRSFRHAQNHWNCIPTEFAPNLWVYLPSKWKCPMADHGLPMGETWIDKCDDVHKQWTTAGQTMAPAINLLLHLLLLPLLRNALLRFLVDTFPCHSGIHRRDRWKMVVRLTRVPAIRLLFFFYLNRFSQWDK